MRHIWALPLSLTLTSCVDPQEMEDIKTRLNKLETKIAQLEKKPAQAQPTNQVAYPEWVTKGSGAFQTNGHRVFYGVGAVSGIKNHALARMTADSRARAEISKIFEVYATSMMKRYAHSPGGQELGEETSMVANGVKTFSANTLNGVEIIDHWIHPDGTIYALARLDVEGFLEQVQASKELNAKLKTSIKAAAEGAFTDLRAEPTR